MHAMSSKSGIARSILESFARRRTTVRAPDTLRPCNCAEGGGGMINIDEFFGDSDAPCDNENGIIDDDTSVAYPLLTNIRRTSHRPTEDTPTVTVDFRPLEWGDEDELFPFVVDEWREIDAATLSPRVMSRHFLITGETGSGKTVSAIKPVLRSALEYRATESPRRASLLVVDPKHELVSIVEDQCVRLDRPCLALGQPGSRRVRLFEGYRGQSAVEAVTYALSLCSPAYVGSLSANDTYWHNSALQIITAIFAAKKAAYDFASIDLWAALKAHTTATSLSDAFQTIGKPSNDGIFFATDLAFCELIMSKPNCLRAFAEVCRYFGMETRDYAKLASLIDAPEGQRGSELSTALLFLTELAGADLNRCIDLTPAWLACSETASIREAVEDGVAIVFSPRLDSAGAEAAGRVLKTKYFEAAFGRNNKVRPMFYICDEFQRFITSDPGSGEQAFLDRCRAYRVSCVLATQSLASIRNRLSELSVGRRTNVEATLNILLGNTGNKFFFRSTERETLEAVERLMPQARSGVASAVQLRPPSQLGVGECYYVLADGSAGRGRIIVGHAAPKLTNQTCVVIRIIGHITMKTALAMQDALMEAATVQLARNVKIELEVYGGDAGAVGYLRGILRRARSFRLGVATSGLANVSGGGALLLSLGDVGQRSAYEDCRLHYRSTLDDYRLNETGAQNNGVDIFDGWEAAESWGRALAKHLFGEHGHPDRRLLIDFSQPDIAELSLGYSGICTFDIDSYPNLYRRLCALDRPIRSSQATALGLLDYTCGYIARFT